MTLNNLFKLLPQEKFLRSGIIGQRVGIFHIFLNMSLKTEALSHGGVLVPPVPTECIGRLSVGSAFKLGG